MLGWTRQKAKTEPAMLDEAFLERLEEHIGAEALRELLADGLIEIIDRLERLAEEVRAERRGPALRIGHDIAGLAGHIGLSALSRAAVEMNRTARMEPVTAVSELAAPVLEVGQSAAEALRVRIEATAPKK